MSGSMPIWLATAHAGTSCQQPCLLVAQARMRRRERTRAKQTALQLEALDFGQLPWELVC